METAEDTGTRRSSRLAIIWRETGDFQLAAVLLQSLLGMRVPSLVAIVVVAMRSSTIVPSSEAGQRQRGGDRGQGRSEQRRAEPRDRDGGRRASGEGPSPMARPVQEGRRPVERQQPQAARNGSGNSRQVAETRQAREPRQAARQPQATQRADRGQSNRERSPRAAGVVRDPGVVVAQRQPQVRTNATQGHFIDLDRGAPNRGSASGTGRDAVPRNAQIAPRQGQRGDWNGSRDGNGYSGGSYARDGYGYRGGSSYRDYNGHRGYKTYNYRGRTYNYYTIYPPPYYYYPYSYGYGPGGRGYFYFDLHYNSHVWYPHTAVRYDSYGTYGYPIGELRLQVRPREAQVFVDGSYAGTVDEFDGTFQSLRLEEGEYQIEIVLEGFEPLVFDVRITPGEKVTYRGDLVPAQP
jgi:hypothetical protein